MATDTTGPAPRLLMDPELRRALDAVPMTPRGAFDLTDIAATRETLRSFAAAVAAATPDEPTVTVEEHRAVRPDGGPDVPVRMLRPTTATGALPVLLWFHGGGQVLGFAAQDDPPGSSSWPRGSAAPSPPSTTGSPPRPPPPAPPRTATPPTGGSSAKRPRSAWTAPGSASPARAAAEGSRRPPPCWSATAAARRRCSRR